MYMFWLIFVYVLLKMEFPYSVKPYSETSITDDDTQINVPWSQPMQQFFPLYASCQQQTDVLLDVNHMGI